MGQAHTLKRKLAIRLVTDEAQKTLEPYARRNDLAGQMTDDRWEGRIKSELFFSPRRPRRLYSKSA